MCTRAFISKLKFAKLILTVVGGLFWAPTKAPT